MLQIYGDEGERASGLHMIKQNNKYRLQLLENQLKSTEYTMPAINHEGWILSTEFTQDGAMNNPDRVSAAGAPPVIEPISNYSNSSGDIEIKIE